MSAVFRMVPLTRWGGMPCSEFDDIFVWGDFTWPFLEFFLCFLYLTCKEIKILKLILLLYFIHIVLLILIRLTTYLLQYFESQHHTVLHFATVVYSSLDYSRRWLGLSLVTRLLYSYFIVHTCPVRGQSELPQSNKNTCASHLKLKHTNKRHQTTFVRGNWFPFQKLRFCHHKFK